MLFIKKQLTLYDIVIKTQQTNKQTNKYEGFSAGRVEWWEQRPRGLFSTIATKDKRKVDHRPNSLIYENA